MSAEMGLNEAEQIVRAAAKAKATTDVAVAWAEAKKDPTVREAEAVMVGAGNHAEALFASNFHLEQIERSELTRVEKAEELDPFRHEKKT